MKKSVSRMALALSLLGLGIVGATGVSTTTAHAAKLSAVPKNLRGSWGTLGEDFYMVTFTKNSFSFSDVTQTKSKNWVMQKSTDFYQHLKLGKKVKVNKTFTISKKNKHGYVYVHSKSKGDSFTNKYYFKVKGKTLKWSNYPNGKRAEEYTKLPTMASRKAFFGSI
ncbi:hypothetical protein ACFQ44_01890 [Levilactobacillus lanxiensis]|uniref:Uncharacterized protein n=1 Tax=Levilactobacillus lanxiensis TaxID=2799568 RepID=A0ABW4CYR2_9LACO|nr:hypothetical protein [Levilactobacillus lanxiensis]